MDPFTELLVDCYFDELARDHPDTDWAPMKTKAKVSLEADPIYRVP